MASRRTRRKSRSANGNRGCDAASRQRRRSTVTASFIGIDVGIAGTAAGIAKILFVIGIILFIIFLVLGRRR
jgi:uncharacterized membrane protein YtjA (UPF0391 family)